MRLSTSYHFFNGEEHLLASLRSIRAEVDFVSLVCQRISNTGDKISSAALSAIDEAKQLHLIDRLIEYTPDLELPRSQNELNKRRLGLQAALEARCTHFFTMDADEFYRADQLKSAKQFIIRNRIVHSSVSSFFHIKSPCWRAKDTTCCSFITEINSGTVVGGGQYFIDMVDSTRSVVTPERASWRKWLRGEIRHHHFRDDVVAMYHMNFVRKDSLVSKLRNTSTTDQAFLDDVMQKYASWTPGEPFSFPRKGVFPVVAVENEFLTWSPDPP